MKKKNLKNLKLVKKNVSRLEIKDIDKLKGGSGVGNYCNTSELRFAFFIKMDNLQFINQRL